MRALFFAAFAALWLMPSGAQAASGPGGGTPGNWTQMQKFEHYIGELSGALGICRNYDLASELKALADLSPYGRQGWAGMQSFDGIKGGYCGKIAADAKEILGDRDQLQAYLMEKYYCPAGRCAPEGGDASLKAVCRAEADEHLMSLPLGIDDIKSVTMLHRYVGGTRVGVGKEGHEAWVRLKSCSGWLIIELTKGCTPRQSFTRGACSIEGISSY